MKAEEIVETYYFVNSKKKSIKPLIKEYPMLFTREKKVPLNFQLKMAELSEGTSQRRNSERKFRLSMQSRMNKIELRRNIMKIVLKNKDSNLIFQFLNETDHDYPVWYYIQEGDTNQLQGPLTNHAMQTLFEDGALKATTLVKKKLMPDFVQMRYLLNKFCRLRAIQSVDEGHFYDYLAKNSPRKGADSQERLLEEWLGIIGKKIEVDPHLADYSASGKYTADTGSHKKERLSFIMSKESYQDFKTNPEHASIFEKLDIKKSEAPLDRKSFAMHQTRDSNAIPEKSKFEKKNRPRYATSSYRPK